MSTVIGMHLGSYVLVAADTRLTFYPDSGTPHFVDDRTKVRKTRMGLMAGVGLASLLDGVQERLTAENPDHTDRIIAIVKEERHKVPAEWLETGRVRRAVEHETCWMFSYVTGGADPTNWVLRLALAHPRNDYTLGFYGEGSGTVCAPTGFSEAEAGAFHRALQDQIVPLQDLSEMQASITRHSDVCRQVIRFIAERNDTVSSSFHIGVHVLHPEAGSLVGISDVVEDTPVSFSLSRLGT